MFCNELSRRRHANAAKQFHHCLTLSPRQFYYIPSCHCVHVRQTIHFHLSCDMRFFKWNGHLPSTGPRNRPFRVGHLMAFTNPNRSHKYSASASCANVQQMIWNIYDFSMKCTTKRKHCYAILFNEQRLWNGMTERRNDDASHHIVIDPSRDICSNARGGVQLRVSTWDATKSATNSPHEHSGIFQDKINGSSQ